MKTNPVTADSASPDPLGELKRLVDEASAMLADAASAPTENAISALRSRLDAAQEGFTRLYAGAKRQIVDGARNTDSAIRENPYPALAIAAGVGLLAGVLIGRNRR